MSSKSLYKIDEAMFTNFIDLITLHPWLKNDNGGLEHLIISLAENLDEQALLFDLLKRFTYLTGPDFTQCCSAIESQMSNVWMLDPIDTLIAPLHNGRDAFSDSSQMFCHAFKAACASNGVWTQTKFMASVPQAIYAKKSLQNIVLVDEFIGTGKQALGVLQYIAKTSIKDNPKLRIFVVCATCMEVSKIMIEPHVEDYFSSIVLKRGISDHYDSATLPGKVELMNALESRLLSKKDYDTLHNFGYQRSETLYKYQLSTTADNVFPVFHWRWLKDGSARPTVLPPRV